MPDQTLRGFPRLHVNNLTGELVLPDRRHVAVSLQDISPDGVEIHCHPHTARTLQSNSATETSQKAQVYLRFGVPLARGITDLLTRCRISSLATRADGTVEAELAFLCFGGSGRTDLNRLFEEALEPAF